MFIIHIFLVCTCVKTNIESIFKTCRSESDVQTLLQHANVKEDDLLPETQVLHFSSDFLPEQDTVVLLELDTWLLNCFREGQR